MSDGPLLDGAVIDEMMAQLGDEPVRGVIELFLAEIREFAATIAAGAAQPADPACREAARRAAHSLKSGAGQIGAIALADAAARVERAAEPGNPDLAEAAAALASCGAASETALAELLRR
ncbi:MAG: Hpt domain-containing protein [Alphaproteobacteria bacterium]|nr:Hpt domain-containing protein [Alphaproteobacteria bacterium]